jgi:P4 family phage/plasmid primase-like protien
MNLNENHLHELRSSAVSDDIIENARIESVTKAQATELLHWKSCKSGGMRFPYFDLAGQEVYSRIKLDSPLPNRKYEAPKGSKQLLYVPPVSWQRIQTSSDPIIFTEGEKKTLSVLSAGYIAVGLPGVNLKDNSETVNLPSVRPVLENLPLTDRHVIIIFDSDVTSNKNVHRAAKNLASRMITMVDKVAIAVVPPSPDGSKQGIDDYIAATVDDPEALKTLLGSDDFEAFFNSGTTALPKDDDTPADIELAQQFLREQFEVNFELTLRHHRETSFVWHGKSYGEFSRPDLESSIFKWLCGKVPPKRQTPRRCRTIRECIELQVALASQRNPAFWVDQTEEGPNRQFIALDNGILDVVAAFQGQANCLQPHTPKWFSRVCLSFPFDVNAFCPRWIAFLNEMLEGDQDLITLLQQWFGYLLLADTRQQKALILVGDGSNGKSVVLETLTFLLGEANVSNVQLESFGDRFGLMPTIGKLANIIPEVGEIDRLSEGTFKSFVGGDHITIDRKNKSPLTSRPTARLVISTNNLPRFADRTDGVWRRLMVIPFRVQIPDDQQDRDLLSTLQGELPGIFNWALLGLNSLNKQGRFVQPAICSSAVKTYRIESNPMLQFTDEWLFEDPTRKSECGKVYSFYEWWIRENGYRPLSHGHFGKELRRIFKTVERKRESKGGRVWYYQNLGYHPHPDARF